MHRRRRRGVEGRTTGGAGRGVVRRDETENGGSEERREGARGDAHVSTRALQSASPARHAEHGNRTCRLESSRAPRRLGQTRSSGDAGSDARARSGGTATRAERPRRETRDARRSASAPSPTPHRARDPVARPRRRLLVPGERGTCRHRRRARPASACTHTERRRAGGDPTSGAMGFFSFLMSFMAAKKTKVRARRPRRSLAPHPTAAVFFAARNVPRPTDPRPSSPALASIAGEHPHRRSGQQR